MYFSTFLLSVMTGSYPSFRSYCYLHPQERKGISSKETTTNMGHCLTKKRSQISRLFGSVLINVSLLLIHLSNHVCHLDCCHLFAPLFTTAPLCATIHSRRTAASTTTTTASSGSSLLPKLLFVNFF